LGKEKDNDEEDKMPDVIAKVVSQKGTCAAGHGVGDEFIIGEKTPRSMCSWAFYTSRTYLLSLEDFLDFNPLA